MGRCEKIAIVLGGTAPHAELIKRLQNRGYYTILADYLDNPPAKAVADFNIQASTLDREAVLNIAQEHHAKLVISACVDQANITACYVNERLGLHTPYSYEIAEKITNKGYMKKVMLQQGIPTSAFFYIDKTYDFADLDVAYPVMVKPADSNTSNGVVKAENDDELKKYLDAAIKISRNNRAIVEGYMDGQEISAYFYITKGKAHLLLTNERHSVVEGMERVIRCYSIVYPAQLTQEENEQAEEIATEIAKAFHLDNTPLFFQGVIKDGKISVIEFAPRIGGGLSYKVIEESTGFDILSASIDSYLGNEVDVCRTEPDDIYVTNVIYGRSAVLDKVTGTDELISNKVIERYVPYKSSGTEINDHFNSSSRVGAFHVKGKTMDEVQVKIKLAFEQLDILDRSGNSIMRKDLYLGSVGG